MLPHSGWSTTANGSSTASRARKPLGVAAVSAANQWRSPSGREPCHRPPSGLGQGGATGTRSQFDPLSQLAAEAEGGSGAEQRQGAGYWG